MSAIKKSVSTTRTNIKFKTGPSRSKNQPVPAEVLEKECLEMEKKLHELKRLVAEQAAKKEFNGTQSGSRWRSQGEQQQSSSSKKQINSITTTKKNTEKLLLTTVKQTMNSEPAKIKNFIQPAEPQNEDNNNFDLSQFMKNIGMEKYTEVLQSNGFEDFDDICSLDTETLNALKIPAGFQIKLLKKVDQIKNSVVLSNVVVQANSSSLSENIAEIRLLQNLDKHFNQKNKSNSSSYEENKKKKNAEMSIGTDPINFNCVETTKEQEINVAKKSQKATIEKKSIGIDVAKASQENDKKTNNSLHEISVGTDPIDFDLNEATGCEIEHEFSNNNNKTIGLKNQKNNIKPCNNDKQTGKKKKGVHFGENTVVNESSKSNLSFFYSGNDSWQYSSFELSKECSSQVEEKLILPQKKKKIILLELFEKL